MGKYRSQMEMGRVMEEGGGRAGEAGRITAHRWKRRKQRRKRLAKQVEQREKPLTDGDRENNGQGVAKGTKEDGKGNGLIHIKWATKGFAF